MLTQISTLLRNVPIFMICSAFTEKENVHLFQGGVKHVMTATALSVAKLKTKLDSIFKTAPLENVPTKAAVIENIIIEEISTGVIVTDVLGRVSLSNTKAKTLFGSMLANMTPLEDGLHTWMLVDAESGQSLSPEDLPVVRAMEGEECKNLICSVSGPESTDPVFVRINV